MKIYLAIIICFLGIQSLKETSADKKPGSQLFIPPTKDIGLYTFGFSDLLSSLMWVRVVQDIEVCEQTPTHTPYPEYTDDVDSLTHIVTRKLPKARCEQGWVFQMLDVISDLAPGFKSVYTDGGTFLSVLVDDRLGAQKILAKGREYFPENWEIFYRSAYHELFELQNMDQAAHLMRLAGEKGAPKWVYSLSAKLYSRTGRAAFAKPILENVLQQKGTGPHAGRLREQLRKINEILANEQK